MNLAVVLVSDQTIPNVVYLKEIEEKWDKVLFVTTEGMEKKQKSETIAKALDDCSFDRIVVDENMIFDVTQKLENYFSRNNYDKVFVNITGGNKIMSLGAYMFFKNKPFVENIVYLPIGKTTYKQLYPMGEDGKAKDIPLSYRMSVEEYMEALNLPVKSIGRPLNTDLSIKLFEQFKHKKPFFDSITAILRRYRNRDYKKFVKAEKDYEQVKSYLREIGVDIRNYDFKKRRWIDYFSGGWFEEYVFNEINKLKNQGCLDDVKLNIKLKWDSNDENSPSNELDVVFIKDNDLSVIECKSGDLEPDILTNTFYKSAYLKKEFGLAAKSYLALLGDNIFDDNGNIKSKIQSKSKIFGVTLIDKNVFYGKGLGKFFKCK